ncbi:ShlB/FhaC/HecB family hemolysin secretion/activation protein [Brevundimonas sp.]|uniref:ShlB/FhaC/HecB family hemolysin secretion/activation protein n=1 Tax=Brevundimonas sp. TaxID=1871086 RepID=UPI003F6F152F
MIIAPAVLAAVLMTAPDGPQDGLIVDRGRLDRAQPLPDPAQAPTPAEPVPAEEPLAPFVLRAVDIRTPPVVADEIRAATDPFVGQTLDAQGLARLRAAVSAALGNRAALPIVAIDARESASGLLRITAAPGRVGRVAIYGDTRPDVELMRRYAGRLAAEAPLTRQTAERYLSLIADIPGAKTTLESAPSATPGATDLGFDISFTRWVFETDLNNRGSQTLGRTQITGAVTLNGGFRMGDQTRLALTVPTDPENFQYLSLSHRQPIGSDGMAISLAAGKLRTRVEGLNGDATTLGAVLSWPMIRSYRQNLVLSAGIDSLDSDNAVFGNLRATEKTRALRASAAFGQIGTGSTLNASLTLSRGIDGLGSEVDGFTDADFTKINGRLDAAKAFGRSVRISGAVAVQYSEDRTPTAELFSLGGTDFGRGFGSGLLVGDSGYGAKVEAAWRPGFTPRPFAGSEVYAFADGGEARVNARGPFADRTDRLASAGGGVRIAIADRVMLELEGARAVDDPRPEGRRSRFGFAVTARF